MGSAVRVNVAIVSWNPYFDPGGRASTRLSGFSVGFVDPLARHLLARGHGVGLVTPDPGGEANPAFPRRPDGLVHLDLPEVSIPKAGFASEALRLQAALVRLDERLGGLDCVFVVYVFPHVLAVDALRARLGYRVFSFLRGSDLFAGCRADSPHAEAFGGLWPEARRLVIDAVNRSERVYSVSEMMTAAATREGIRVDGMAPSPPLASCVSLEGDRAALRARLLDAVPMAPRPDPSRPWAAYLGRLHPEKRVDVAIEAVGRLGDVELLVAGVGEDETRLRGLGKAAIGFVPPGLVPLLCRCVDVAIHPTTYEFFADPRPNACTNFAHHGVPVVFADDPDRPGSGLREIVSPENYAALRVDPGVPRSELVASIAARVRRVLGDPELASTVASANVAWVASQRLDRVFGDLEAELIA